MKLWETLGKFSFLGSENWLIFLIIFGKNSPNFKISQNWKKKRKRNPGLTTLVLGSDTIHLVWVKFLTLISWCTFKQRTSPVQKALNRFQYIIIYLFKKPFHRRQLTGLQASTSKQTDLWNLRLLLLWNNPLRDGGAGGAGGDSSTTHNAHLPYPRLLLL